MKLTDEQIIKALECCVENKCTYDCPFYHDSCIKCRYSTSEIIKFAFALINRQKAEIENLKADKDALINGQLTLQKMYAEAIKEFAEGLKPMMFSYYDCLKESAEGRPYKGDTLMDYEVVDMIEDCIDNLVKEMVGE